MLRCGPLGIASTLQLAWTLLIAASLAAQQSSPDLPINPNTFSPLPPVVSPPPPPSNAPIFHDLDLLRRGGFSEADEAMISLHILSKDGRPVAPLQSGDYTLTVNGTLRTGRLHAPGDASTRVVPLVLLVFPPNDPTVHYIGIREARKYFSVQPQELMPWRVGILDSNGKMTPFTDGRSQLLLNLDILDHTIEPMQYTTDAFVSTSHRWEGSWLGKAQDAVALMQSFNGPKVILAMNPIAESMYGNNDFVLAHNGPESLTQVAQHVGAHIYIANVGGPDVIIPGGSAAEDHPAQINTPAGPILGTLPSGNQRIDPRQTAALNYFAYRSSIMAQTALDTLGGFSNSLKDLAGQIHHDLDETYSLNFDLTLTDRDKGIPEVQVRMANHDLRVAILDVVPVGAARDSFRETVSKEVMEKIRHAAKRPVSSPDFRIHQHIDYFPMGGGLQAVLPMSGMVEWTGKGHGPKHLSVAESVEDLGLSSTLLEHDIQAVWDGRAITWERDGHLKPGHYIWRIAVHDAEGNVYSAAEQKVTVDFPHDVSIAASSLIVGKTCREQAETTSGLRRRSGHAAEDNQIHFQVDPMHAADCRLKPDAISRYSPSDTLHAFVRIYPYGKLDKRKPESWTAKFVLHAQNGAVETEQELPFTVDSGSGYLAYIEMPLNLPAISAGPHTLDVQMRGPGIRHDLEESQQLSILPAESAN